jgi:YihY family inner membrane protein
MGMRGLPARVFDFYWGEGIADDVPALTYYLLLSLAPFALGVAAIEALLLEDFASALSVAEQVNRFLPDAVHEDVRRLVVGVRDDSPQLLAVALVAMLWTSSGAIGVIERCESRMLGRARHHMALGRLWNVGLGALVAVGVVLASATTSVVTNVSGALSLRGDVPGALLLALNVVGSVVLFAVVYRHAPRSRLSWRAALLGGLPAGIGLQVVPAVVGLYVGAAATLQAARLFLLLAVMLLGLYVMAMVILCGAGLAVRAERRLRARDEERLARRERPAPAAPERERGPVGLSR